LKYHEDIHRYIQTEIYFLDISSLGVSYQYVVKIKQKFRHQDKWEFGSANSKKPKNNKNNPNQQPPDNQSKTQENKGKGKNEEWHWEVVRLLKNPLAQH
jgi:heme-binding NEAT domain protein